MRHGALLFLKLHLTIHLEASLLLLELLLNHQISVDDPPPVDFNEPLVETVIVSYLLWVIHLVGLLEILAGTHLASACIAGVRLDFFTEKMGETSFQGVDGCLLFFD